MNLGSEAQALEMRMVQQTQQFHNEVMSADAEHLRVGYDAVPRRSRRAKLAIAAGTLFVLTTLGVLIAL
ncbi:MAG: hypothetical protein WCC60_20060 [Ilumatobacteraceae bacterium]